MFVKARIVPTSIPLEQKLTTVNSEQTWISSRFSVVIRLTRIFPHCNNPYLLSLGNIKLMVLDGVFNINHTYIMVNVLSILLKK